MKLGIDLGGTKIEIIALDNQGIELLRRRVPTPQGDYSTTLHAIENLVHSAEAELGQRGSVGIGTPGSISKATGLLKNSNSVHLNGKPVLQDLETLLQRKVMISNDANCFALSECSVKTCCCPGMTANAIWNRRRMPASVTRVAPSRGFGITR